jgi:hypothetical protein
MKNVEMTVEGNVLTIKVDLSKGFWAIQVDFARDVDESAVHRAPEDLGDFGVIDWHRDDLKAGIGQISRHVEGRLEGLPLRLSPSACLVSRSQRAAALRSW